MKEDLWRRWRAGDSISVISRALGKPPGPVFTVLKHHGGIAPAERTRRAGRLSTEDRESISRGLEAGASLRSIADWEGFTAGRLTHLRYVAADTGTGEVVGWVAASPVSARPVYAGVVEHSLYVHPGCQAHGIGRALLSAFIAAREDAGIWTIQSGIFPENAASLSPHRTLGFRVVGTRERVGRHHGTWRDVVLIERRSPVAPPDRHR